MKNGIVAVLVNRIVRLFMSGKFASSKRMENSNERRVCLPDFFLSVGIFSFIFFVVCFIVGAIFSPNIFLLVTLALFALVSASLILAWRNCYITYDDNGFMQSTFWGKKKCFTYDMVTGWKDRNGAALDIYLGKEKIKIDTLAVNKAEFLQVIESKCEK